MWRRRGVAVALVVVGATAAVQGEARAGVRAAPSYVRADVVGAGRPAATRATRRAGGGRCGVGASRAVTVRVSADVRVGSASARRRPRPALVRARTFRLL